MSICPLSILAGMVAGLVLALVIVSFGKGFDQGPRG
jgi:tetrahydromethanopterin S-methyltransferase subunit G